MAELLKCTSTVRWNIRQCIQKRYRCKQFLLLLYNRCIPDGNLVPMKTEAADYLQSNSSRFGHSVQLIASNLNHICRTNSYAVIFEYVYIFTFINIYFCFAVKIVHLELFKLFPIYFWNSGIFEQFTPKIRHFLSELLPRFTHSLQNLARPDIFFQGLPRYLQE